jgi:hypothetical protein
MHMFINFLILRIPLPKLPPMFLFPELFGNALSIAIVSFAMNISMAKMFSKKYKYEISPDQVSSIYVLYNICK